MFFLQLNNLKKKKTNIKYHGQMDFFIKKNKVFATKKTIEVYSSYGIFCFIEYIF